MGLRSYLFLMSVATLISWGAWFFVIVSIDPTASPVLGLVAFYLTSFLSLLGSFTLLGFFFRWIWYRSRRPHRYKVSTAFRQGLWWSLALNVSLALQSQNMLSWWLIGLMLILFISLELSFLMSANRAME